MAGEKNNVNSNESFGGLINIAQVDTNSRKIRKPNVIPGADDSSVLESAYQFFQILVKCDVFQSINFIDHRAFSTWLNKFDQETNKLLRHVFVELMLLVSFHKIRDHDKLFKQSTTSKPPDKVEFNGVIEDHQVTACNSEDACRAALSVIAGRDKVVGLSQVISRNSYHTMDFLKEDTCCHPKTPMQGSEESTMNAVIEVFPDRRVRIMLNPRLVTVKTMVVTQLQDATKKDFHCRNDTKNLDTTGDCEKRPGSCRLSTRSDDSPTTTEDREPRYDGYGSSTAAATVTAAGNTDTRPVERDCPGNGRSEKERPLRAAVARCGGPVWRTFGTKVSRTTATEPWCNVDRKRSEPNGPPRRAPGTATISTTDHRCMTRDPTELWQLYSGARIRAGSDRDANAAVIGKRNAPPLPQGLRNNGRATNATTSRRGNLGGAVTRPARGPVNATIAVNQQPSSNTPVRIDRPVEIYQNSRLPVVIRPGTRSVVINTGPRPTRTPQPAQPAYGGDWEDPVPSPDHGGPDRTCSYSFTIIIKHETLPANVNGGPAAPQPPPQQQHGPRARDRKPPVGSSTSSPAQDSHNSSDSDDGLDLLAGISRQRTLSAETIDLSTERSHTDDTSADDRENSH